MPSGHAIYCSTFKIWTSLYPCDRRGYGNSINLPFRRKASTQGPNKRPQTTPLALQMATGDDAHLPSIGSSVRLPLYYMKKTCRRKKEDGGSGYGDLHKMRSGRGACRVISDGGGRCWWRAAALPARVA